VLALPELYTLSSKFMMTFLNLKMEEHFVASEKLNMGEDFAASENFSEPRV